MDLEREFLSQKQCRRCGGCATYCSTTQYFALELGEDGYPNYTDQNRCSQCGVCYLICPASGDLDEHVKEMLSWQDPCGRVLGVGLYRAKDEKLRKESGNGGALPALLIHMLNTGYLRGICVPRANGDRLPLVVHEESEIVRNEPLFMEPGLGSLLYRAAPNGSGIAANGGHPGGGSPDSEKLGFVGRPCQIHALRKMEYLGVMPAESFAMKIGIFCSDEAMNQGRGNGCGGCSDHYAQYADVAISDYCVKNDYSAIIARTTLGMMVLSGAAEAALEYGRGSCAA
ncbi:Coenzyme F420 hydrogenase/dehydrogenase, beta subunit C-terminal domain [Desulfonatronum thiosulfatophilum]|uniref:Coenzyme F420 hydrogenase/dehydrogenase, beta subunit C-terminal domain n=1 Tax=Desulfonatronum thiosulfatophilum TaxID=617002 RepID=UPI001379A41A|nr:Coenzyme F420 hydrogenase/dehydrogenase, beta subunit C-terminal domain [Desulfonatronum thiosulfatophilum]